MTVTGAWQSPSTNTSTAGPDVFDAVELYLQNQDVGGGVLLSATSAEMAAAESNVVLGAQVLSDSATEEDDQTQGWVKVGASRDIRVAGDNDDDDSLDVFLTGVRLNL